MAMMNCGFTTRSWIILLALLLAGASAKIKKQSRQDWNKIGKEELKKAREIRPIVGQAKNTILMMGDGMGINNNMAARFYHAQNEGIDYRDALFSFEKLPYVALAMTYASNAMITDSAAAATAYHTGVKGPYATIGVTEDVVQGQCHTYSEEHEVYSTLWHCAEAGKAAGIVTTTRLTHASPSAVYAHSAERFWETDSDIPEAARGKCKDIASQLIDRGDFLTVMMGGGRTKFLPNTTNDPEYVDVKGERLDGKNLIQEWKDKQPDDKVYEYVERLEDFQKLDPKKIDRLLAMFEPGHMHYEVNRQKDINIWPEPSLSEMVEKAIKILEKNEKGFCLFVESGRIDHAHHDAKALKALVDTVEFSRAVDIADISTKADDTLLVVTADHSLPLTTGGYNGINTNILGLATEIVNGTNEEIEIAKDGLPYSVLSYANGPPTSYNYHHTNGSLEFPNERRRNLTDDYMEAGPAYEPDYLQYAPIPLRFVTHSGEEVGIYARGPMAHLFHSVHENTYIAHVMMYATCIGSYSDDCPNQSDAKGWPEDPEITKLRQMAESNNALSLTAAPTFLTVLMSILVTSTLRV